MEFRKLAKRLVILSIIFFFIKIFGYFEKYEILKGSFLREFLSIVLSVTVVLYDRIPKFFSKRLKKIIDSYRTRKLEGKNLKKVLEKYNFLRIFEIKGDKNAEELLYKEWSKCFDKASDIKIGGIAQFENLGKDLYDYQKYYRNRDFNPDFKGVLTKNFIENTSTDIKILLLYPFKSNIQASEKVEKFIKERIDEINEERNDKEKITVKIYREDVIATYHMIQELNKERQGHKIQVVFYDYRPVFRYILFPDKVFVGPYLPGREGHETIIFECAKGKHSLYHTFFISFEYCWDEYKDKFEENIIN